MKQALLAVCVLSLGFCSCATQRAVLPASPRQWWVHVWVGTPKSVFWVQLDETGTGNYWVSDSANRRSEGKIKTTAVISRRIYDSVRSCFNSYHLKDVPMPSEGQVEKMMGEKPFYIVSFAVRIGEQQLSFDTPFLKSFDAYAGLPPIVEECARLLPEDARKGIDL
jgi:hypothetical protein